VLRNAASPTEAAIHGTWAGGGRFALTSKQREFFPSHELSPVRTTADSTIRAHALDRSRTCSARLPCPARLRYLPLLLPFYLAAQAHSAKHINDEPRRHGVGGRFDDLMPALRLITRIAIREVALRSNSAPPVEDVTIIGGMTIDRLRRTVTVKRAGAPDQDARVRPARDARTTAGHRLLARTLHYAGVARRHRCDRPHRRRPRCAAAPDLRPRYCEHPHGARRVRDRSASRRVTIGASG
jgi:hypothetical protein